MAPSVIMNPWRNSYTHVMIAIIRHLWDLMTAARKEKAAAPRAYLQGDFHTGGDDSILSRGRIRSFVRGSC